MSTILRVGVGYSRKCSQCEFYMRELKRVKEELDIVLQQKEDLEDKIRSMIEDKAVEDLNIFSKLDQITNMVERSGFCKVNV